MNLKYREVEQVTERLTEEFKGGRNILRKGIKNIHHVGFGQFYAGEAIDKLSEYETAEDEGRLVILPKCSIGDTVYIPIDFQNKIYTGTVDGFEYSPRRNKWVVEIITDDGEKCYEAFDDFGKTFFLDVVDAAKALKEMEIGNETD